MLPVAAVLPLAYTHSEAESSTEAAPSVDVIVNMKERKTGGLGCGGGLSAAATGEGAFPGLIGSFTYNERNLFGLNQRLSASAEIGQVDKLFRIQHTDPWVNSDPHRTSRTVQVLNNRTLGRVQQVLWGYTLGLSSHTPGGCKCAHDASPQAMLVYMLAWHLAMYMFGHMV